MYRVFFSKCVNVGTPYIQNGTFLEDSSEVKVGPTAGTFDKNLDLKKLDHNFFVQLCTKMGVISGPFHIWHYFMGL